MFNIQMLVPGQSWTETSYDAETVGELREVAGQLSDGCLSQGTTLRIVVLETGRVVCLA